MSRYAHVAVACDGARGNPISAARKSDVGRLRPDNTAIDLVVDEGEVVEILEESGPWIWIATADGHRDGFRRTPSAGGQPRILVDITAQIEQRHTRLRSRRSESPTPR